MTNSSSPSWTRQLQLLVYKSPTSTKNEFPTIDLSQFRVTFQIMQNDKQSPNHAIVRVYNLKPSTVAAISGEYGAVQLSAGYVNQNYSTIFSGTIKQFHIGRINATDSYLDMYCADGDIPYIQGVVYASLPKGSTVQKQLDALAGSMPELSTAAPLIITKTDLNNPTQLRNKVMFGMSNAFLSDLANTLGASWSIQNGRIQIVDAGKYVTGQIVDINVRTGLLGTPEQTDDGIKVKTLLNSAYRIGAQVRINNADINQTSYSNGTTASLNPTQYSGIENLAPVTADGLYYVMVIEHSGDTRGDDWSSELTCLAMTAGVVQANSMTGAGK
jgi:hypothetical protein